MKAIVLVDVHEDEDVLKWIIREKFDTDVIIVAGDVALWAKTDFYRRFFEELSRREYTIFYVPGNQDPIIDLGLKNAVNLHGRSEVYEGIILAGLGGSAHTPFNTPFELDDNEAEDILKRLPAKVDILVSHCPPKGTKCDRAGSGGYGGSLPVRDFVLKYQPRVVLSGHIHEARSTDRIGETYIVNPGAAINGFYAKLMLQGDVMIELLKI